MRALDIGELFIVCSLGTAGCTSPTLSNETASVTPTDAALSMQHVMVASTPNAACKLHADSDPSHITDLYADFEGILHLYAAQAAPDAPHGLLTLDCTEEAGAVEHLLDLRDPKTFEPVVARFKNNALKLRPALTGDLMQLDPNKLLADGYPPRPDPVAVPALFDAWVEAVSTPMKLVPPKTVERLTDAGTYNNKGWGGNVMTGGSYGVVMANIPVPSVPASPAGDAVVWAGLGGYGEASLIQSGVDFQATGSVASYHMFYEYWHNAGRDITNVAIQPGDNILVWDIPCDDAGNLDMTGVYGCFYFQDTTTGVATTASMRQNSKNTPFTGASAEFIVEGQSDPMPNFGTMTINAYVLAQNQDGSSRVTYFPGGDSFDTLNFVNRNGDLRVAASASAGSTTTLVWKRGQ